MALRGSSPRPLLSALWRVLAPSQPPVAGDASLRVLAAWVDASSATPDNVRTAMAHHHGWLPGVRPPRLGFYLRRLELPVTSYLTRLGRARGEAHLGAAAAVLRCLEPSLVGEEMVAPPFVEALIGELDALRKIGDLPAVDLPRLVDPRRRFPPLGFTWVQLEHHFRLELTWDGRPLADLLHDLKWTAGGRLRETGVTRDESGMLLHLAANTIAALGTSVLRPRRIRR